jgi:hypothetical protein
VKFEGRPEVCVTGISGLANNIFQVLAAIYYCEKYNAKLYLDKRDKRLRWGTSRMFGRNTCIPKERITVVNEDDITQIYAGMLCSHFILSESTYHYIIALFACIQNPLKEEHVYVSILINIAKQIKIWEKA